MRFVKDKKTNSIVTWKNGPSLKIDLSLRQWHRGSKAQNSSKVLMFNAYECGIMLILGESWYNIRWVNSCSRQSKASTRKTPDNSSGPILKASIPSSTMRMPQSSTSPQTITTTKLWSTFSKNTISTPSNNHNGTHQNANDNGWIEKITKGSHACIMQSSEET